MIETNEEEQDLVSLGPKVRKTIIDTNPHFKMSIIDSILRSSNVDEMRLKASGKGTMLT